MRDGHRACTGLSELQGCTFGQMEELQGSLFSIVAGFQCLSLSVGGFVFVFWRVVVMRVEARPYPGRSAIH